MTISNYIGGEYAAADLKEYISLEKGNAAYFFPTTLREKKVCYFETGTDALAAIIHERSRGNTDLELWVPKNYCFETLDRLKIKLAAFSIAIEVQTYSTPEKILPSPTKLSGIILLHFNCFQDFQALKWEKNVFTMEDFVQAPLDIIKFQSDYAFNSLRKLGNLELSVAYLDDPANIETTETSTYYVKKKKAGFLKQAFFGNGKQEVEKEYLRLFQQANEELFSKQIQPANIEEIQILNQIDFISLLQKRKENHDFLRDELGTIQQLKVLQGEYMYLMIACESRDALKKHLASQMIFTAVHWLDSNTDEVADRLSLHIDHRYTQQDLVRVVTAIRSFYGEL